MSIKKREKSRPHEEQRVLLPAKLQRQYRELFQEFTERKTREAIVAKDADWPETAFQCREYEEMGCPKMKVWIDNVGKALKTKALKDFLPPCAKKVSVTGGNT
jgi:5'-deoxynucleotidase YfbR-like HD superfamily hydrolase